MRDIRNLNIWKNEERTDANNSEFLQAGIVELNLSVRSFNCLKRANCHTIQDILNCMGENGQGLRSIRNLGSRSETEIMERLQEFKETFKCRAHAETSGKVTLIKPAKKIWDREIGEFQLSNFAHDRLKACGIRTIGDLYATNPKREPGWYAVRELFEKLPSSR